MGFILIFMLNRLDDRLELAEDIEADLGEPVLGQIPQAPEDSANEEGKMLVFNLEPHNIFSEAIRGVRSASLFGAREPEKRPQVMLVSSAIPGDGKTTFTTNFAATLARSGHRVLLVDADLRRGNIHQYFGVPRGVGLREILEGTVSWKDTVHHIEGETLQVITTGELPSNPGELLIRPAFREFILDVRESLDFILIDCPPLTSIDDSFCLLSASDGLLFIVKAGHTSMRFARNALSSVRQRGATILGIVVNGIAPDHPSYYYYHYHNYYAPSLKGTDRPSS